MCVSISVALQEVQHHNTVAGVGQSSIYGKYASKKLLQKFFLATDTLCMGYEYFFQKFTRLLLLSILISTVSTLQILILETFFYFFLSIQPLFILPHTEIRRPLVINVICDAYHTVGVNPYWS
jgi:hypothetical protein